MTHRIAFECYADAVLFQFLRTHCRADLLPFHAYGQGEVVNAVLVRRTCVVGLVDEDPGATHHRERDKANVVSATEWLELRSRGQRHLVIVKPNLERCFLGPLRIAGIESELPQDFAELQALLNVERSPKHAVFRRELDHLLEVSRARKRSTLATNILELLEPLLP